MVERRGNSAALLILAALSASACAHRSAPHPSALGSWQVEADDRGESCADLSELRVCWTANGGVRIAPRPVPKVPAASPLGWRCTGSGSARTCTGREKEVGVFTCMSGRCVEGHPRLPDDGEWSCADMAGAVVCSGGDAAAGIPKAVSDAAWICGQRHGAHAEREASRICVDLAPDFPNGAALGWRCSYTAEHGSQRVCEGDPSAHEIGDLCDAAHPCLDGLLCTASRCVPHRPAPSCAFDRDCDGHRCRFGTCQAEAP